MHKLKQEQFLPVTLDEAWEFFATPKNLNAVTPKDLVFEITSEVPDKMYEGLILTYRISPMAGVKLNWCTEITHIRDNQFFVDEQRKGPYNIWHHEHHFKAVAGGVEMTDIVTYVLPFGILGKLVHPWLVKPKLEQIFSYRFKKVDELFG